MVEVLLLLILLVLLFGSGAVLAIFQVAGAVTGGILGICLIGLAVGGIGIGLVRLGSNTVAFVSRSVVAIRDNPWIIPAVLFLPVTLARSLYRALRHPLGVMDFILTLAMGGLFWLLVTMLWVGGAIALVREGLGL